MNVSILEYIINKKPIVDTYSAENFINDPNLVEDNYRKHLNTYIKVDDESFDKKFVNSIKRGKIAKGYVSAPFGYGKTSKALSLWSYCENNNILSIPPFKFDNRLESIIDAVYGWTRYIYTVKYPEYVEKIDEIYNKYKKLGIEKEIEYLVKREGLTRGEAESIIRNLIERGRLIIKITPKDLVKFLNELLQEVILNHFEGLAIFVDEVQGLNLETINELRNFVFELSTININLGILFIIPDYEEEKLEAKAGDLIHRLKSGFYLNLKNIYDADFPKKLWEKYGSFYKFNPYEIITEACLRSIGEIASREDLGDGPRTVIKAFVCACRKYKEKFEPYDVFDFIDDILNENIKFIKQKYLDALNIGLSLKEVNNERKRKVIMLLGAFPRGISEDAVKKYGLYNEFLELSNKYYGIEIIYNIEGYTLKGLVEESSGGIIEQLIRKFRHEFDESWNEEMLEGFKNYIIPEIFPKRKGTQIIGWRYLSEKPIFEGYYLLLQGTFNLRYPYRFVDTYILYKEDLKSEEFINKLIEEKGDVIFKFILDKNRDEDELVVDYDNGEIIFKFNVLKKIGEKTLPGELKKLQEYVRPQEVTPMFMLSLLTYIDRKVPQENNFSEMSYHEIDYLKKILIKYLKRFLFSEELANSHKLNKRYEEMIEEVFNRICEHKFKSYKTLIHSINWEKDLERYRHLLESLPISVRRGAVHETTKKELVSKLTGSKNPSVAGFDDECRSGKWKELIELCDWGKGDKIKVKFKKHPLEEEILKKFIENMKHPIDINEIIEYGLSLGYLEEEVEEILKILKSRGYIEIKNGYIFKVEDITNADVLNEFNNVEELAKKVVTIYNKYGKPIPHIPIKIELKDKIKNEKSSDHLYSYLERIRDWERILEGYLKNIKKEMSKNKEDLLNKISKILEKIEDLKEKLDEIRKDVIKTHFALGGIAKHLDYLMLESKKECNNLRTELLTFREKISTNKDNEDLAEILKNANLEYKNLEYKFNSIQNDLKYIKSWITILRKLEDVFDKIQTYKEYLDINEEENKFNELLDDIIQGFARERRDYLKMYKDIEKDIEIIEENIRKKERSLRNEFNRLQDEIKTKINIIFQELKDHIDIKPYNYMVPFSIEDKDIAYKNLVDYVKMWFKNTLKKLYDYITKLETDIEIKLECNEEFIAKINKIKDELNSIDINMVNEDNIIDSVESLKHKILDVWNKLKEIKKEVLREIKENEGISEEKLKVIELLNKNKEMPLEELAKILNKSVDEGFVKWLMRINGIEIIVRKK